MKLCFLVSGNGGNLKFFHLAAQKGIIKNLELSVIADRKCGALTYSYDAGLTAKLIDYSVNDNTQLLAELSELAPEIIITNWHKIIDKTTVGLFKGRLLNLHYSLLPAFSGKIGLVPIKEAYKKNCQFVGATCHHVNEKVDDGLIISQGISPVDKGFDQKVDDVFRIGCLILLDSLERMSDENLVSRDLSDSYQYSPKLVFNEAQFENLFWSELSEL